MRLKSSITEGERIYSACGETYLIEPWPAHSSLLLPLRVVLLLRVVPAVVALPTSPETYQ